MVRFKRIVPRHSERRDAEMPKRKPALHLVMAGAVEYVGDPNGRGGCGSFKARKSSRVVNDIIWQEDFLAPTRLHVASGSVIQSAKYRDSGEKKDILAVKEAMLLYGY